jgi:hypothetical protein
MQIDDCFSEAIEKVVAWDLPDEAIAEATCLQARHLAALDSDQLSEVALD